MGTEITLTFAQIKKTKGLSISKRDKAAPRVLGHPRAGPESIQIGQGAPLEISNSILNFNPKLIFSSMGATKCLAQGHSYDQS
jgi:hypothetical protein